MTSFPSRSEDYCHMLELIRRFRGLGVALVVLAISAGAVFAGSPFLQPTSETETPTVEEPTTVEEGDEDQDEDQDEDADTDQDADEGEAVEGTEDATDTHGGLVSEAAQMETPEAFANHGEFVSCVAHLNNGHWKGGEPSFEVVLDQLTPDLCAQLAEEAAAAKDAAKAEREAARDAAKAERDAAKAERATQRAAAKAAREAARAARGH